MEFDEWIKVKINEEYRLGNSDSLYRVGYKFYDKRQTLQMAISKNQHQKVLEELINDRSTLQSEYCKGLEGQLKTAKLERVDQQLKKTRQKYLECMEARELLEKEFNKEVA